MAKIIKQQQQKKQSLFNCEIILKVIVSVDHRSGLKVFAAMFQN